MANEDTVLDEAMDNLKEAGQRIRATQSLMRSQGMTDGENYRDLLTRLSTALAMTVLQGRQEVIEQLEHDRDALLASYAQMVPAELDHLDAAERHQIYKMLRLKVVISPDASLEVSGALRDCFAREDQDACPRLAQDGDLLCGGGRGQPLRR
jgi:hypothetical protein